MGKPPGYRARSPALSATQPVAAITRCPHFRPGAAVGSKTAAQKRNPLRHMTLLDRDPAAINHALRSPVRKTLLGRYRNKLVRPLAEGGVISGKRKEPSTHIQARSHRWRM